MNSIARSWYERLRPAARHVREQDLLLHAAGLAFYALITIVPSLVVAAWATSVVVGEDRTEELAEDIGELAPDGVAAEQLVENAVQVGTGLGIGALVAALWPATAYGGGLVRAFDHIAGRDHRRTALRGRLKALTLLVLLPAFSLGVLGASYLIEGAFDDGALAFVGWVLALAGGLVAAALVCAAIYLVFAPERPGIWPVLAGGIVAGAGIAIASAAFVAYVGHGADFEDQVAGAGAATLVLAALWCYVANVCLLVGFMVLRAAAGQEGPLRELAVDLTEHGLAAPGGGADDGPARGEATAGFRDVTGGVPPGNDTGRGTP